MLQGRRVCSNKLNLLFAKCRFRLCRHHYSMAFVAFIKHCKLQQCGIIPTIPSCPPSALTTASCSSGTLFLYGQTGSGKTYTHEALTQWAAATIFRRALEESGQELAAVTLSVVEIYCEQVKCLLTGREVTLRQPQRGGGLVLEGAGEQVRV